MCAPSLVHRAHRCGSSRGYGETLVFPDEGFARLLATPRNFFVCSAQKKLLWTFEGRRRGSRCSSRRSQVPLAMAYCSDHHTLVTASADLKLLQWHLDDVPSIKHFTLKSRWPTQHAAMSVCWSSPHRLLYSGTSAGTIQGDRLAVHLGNL